MQLLSFCSPHHLNLVCTVRLTGVAIVWAGGGAPSIAAHRLLAYKSLGTLTRHRPQKKVSKTNVKNWRPIHSCKITPISPVTSRWHTPVCRRLAPSEERCTKIGAGRELAGSSGNTLASGLRGLGFDSYTGHVNEVLIYTRCMNLSLGTQPLCCLHSWSGGLSTISMYRLCKMYYWQ